MTYTALVIAPPLEICNSIQDIRKVHDKAYDRWMPHVNICFPFIPPTEFDKFANHFNEILKNFPPF